MTHETQTPVDELTGRELDLVVHREVFGLEPDWLGWQEPKTPLNLPAYSTEIAAAWAVVEKVRIDSGVWVEIYAESDGAFVECKIDCSCLSLDLCRHPKAAAKTAPLAVCRAALKAVRGET